MILGSSTDTPKNEMRDRRKLIQCFKKNLAFAICRSPIMTPPTPPPPPPSRHILHNVFFYYSGYYSCLQRN